MIQGGMGAGVSDWRLAHAVSKSGQIGVVSGTALDVILVRRLQQGDPGGHSRRALAAFPDQTIAGKIFDRYFVEGGIKDGQSFANKAMVGDRPSRQLNALLVASNFVEVYLAKEDHNGLVGINFLQKIPAPLLASLYGAMLAGVDVVLVGAGIPLEIPAIIDGLMNGEQVSQGLYVADASSTHRLSFDPTEVLECELPALKRPLFFPIIASVTLANLLVKKCKGKVDGLVIEAPTAGGHNAPPRGALKLNDRGEPIYGPRDVVDLAAVTALGLPFWLAGSYASPEKLQGAIAEGATGVQLGTLFALCEESGLRADLKTLAIQRCIDGTTEVFRDPVASPTGFPFQVMKVPGTLSEKSVYDERCRVCDLGYLREAYELQNGKIAWRCSSEPIDDFLKKGGKLEETVGRKCLCNSLMANIGLGQARSDGSEELPLVTSGEDLSGVLKLLRPGKNSYGATDVIDYVLERVPTRDTPQA